MVAVDGRGRWPWSMVVVGKVPFGWSLVVVGRLGTVVMVKVEMTGLPRLMMATLMSRFALAKARIMLW